MPYTKRTNDLHVHISDEADAALDLLSSANQKPKNQLASELIERTLLGECYALKVAAIRFAKSGLSGIDRD